MLTHIFWYETVFIDIFSFFNCKFLIYLKDILVLSKILFLNLIFYIFIIILPQKYTNIFYNIL